MYVADHCPKLRYDALRFALSHVVNTMNANLYQVLHHKLQQSQRYMTDNQTFVLPTFNNLMFVK